ncbi:MAG: universal stress protein [Methylococcales bacterium]|nr:universal stress protein [Methylococcales bacterium]
MTTYQHILLAVDFSNDTDFVINKTGDIASLSRAKISIVHILDNIPMPDTSYGTVIALNDEADNALLKQEKENLNTIGDRLNVPENQRWLIWGSPKEEICALAAQENIDLIIVGSHGRHGLALLLGSTANDVLHHAPCDVLAVRLPNE